MRRTTGHWLLSVMVIVAIAATSLPAMAGARSGRENPVLPRERTEGDAFGHSRRSVKDSDSKKKGREKQGKQQKDREKQTKKKGRRDRRLAKEAQRAAEDAEELDVPSEVK